MKVQDMWMVVVTYPEWLNWIAWGHLRLNTRIAWVTGPNDFAGFTQLMNRCPDLRVDDEQAFVLARLRPEWRSLLKDVPGSTVPEVANLSLEAVSEFLPVTERAARLLEADASRARALLSAPLFEAAWSAWTADRREADAHRRGQALASALGISEVDLAQIPPIILRYLTGGVQAPNADRLGKLKGSRAYGWGAAFSLLGPLAGEEGKKDLTRDFNLTALVESRRQDYSLTAPILNDALGLEQAAKLEEGLRIRFGVNLSVKQLVTFWHYEQLLTDCKAVSLESLVLDMTTLAVGSTCTAANAAYLIGRLMDDAAVTSLLYAAKPSDWPAIAPGTVQAESLDVMKAAARLRQQQVYAPRAPESQMAGPCCVTDPAVQLPASGVATNSAVNSGVAGPRSIVEGAPSNEKVAPTGIGPAVETSNSGESVASGLLQPPTLAADRAAQPDIVHRPAADAQMPSADSSSKRAHVSGSVGTEDMFKGSTNESAATDPTANAGQLNTATVVSETEGSNRGKQYPESFKLEAVRRVKAGQKASAIARELGVSVSALNKWVRALQGDGERQ